MTIPFFNLLWFGKRIMPVTHEICVKYMEVFGAPIICDDTVFNFRNRSHSAKPDVPSIIISFEPKPEPTFSLSYTVQAQHSIVTPGAVYLVVGQMMAAIRGCWRWKKVPKRLLTLEDASRCLNKESVDCLAEALNTLRQVGAYTPVIEDSVVFRDMFLSLMCHSFSIEESDLMRFYASIIRTPHIALVRAVKMLEDDILHPPSCQGMVPPVHFVCPTL